MRRYKLYAVIVPVLFVSVAFFSGCLPSVPKSTQKTEPPKEEETVVEVGKVAGVGATGKGQYTETEKAIVPGAAAVASFYAMKERLAYNVQVKQALDLFEATEGRKPNSQEEFEEKILKANNLVLPELPQGCRYEYDPKTGDLMVMELQVQK